MYENDYLTQQIERICKVLSKMFIKKDVDVDKEDSSLLNKLKYMIEVGNVNEAEDLLFENVEADDIGYCIEAAIYFYAELNKLDNDTLKKYNFSKDEILDGLNEIQEKYNFDTIII